MSQDWGEWTPPTDPLDIQDNFDSSWKPPSRPIRGPSGLGEEVEGDLPPLASETPKEEESEEFPFTGPMPFSLRENPNRPPTPTPSDEYSKVFGRIGDVASGTTDIFGQPYDRPGSPSVKKLSVFPTDDEESVLPEMKSEPETWIGGFGKGLWNEFGRWAANPSTMLSSMEPGPAAAKTALADILKIGESPAAKLAKGAYSKVKTAKMPSLPKTKTPEDVAALEAQLRGTLAEPFRPGALETGPVAKVDLSTGIPKPRIDAATFAQMRDARAIETARAEQATNAARVAPDPPRPSPEASISTRPAAGMNPQPRPPIVQTPPAIAAMPEIDPRAGAEVQNIRVNPQTGELIIPGVTNRLPDVPPIETMPSRIEELGQMPVEELESIATPTTLDEVGTPNFGGLTEPVIPEGLADEIPPESIPEEVIPEASALEGEVIDPRVSPLTNTKPTIGIDYKGERRISPGTQEEYHFLQNLNQHISGGSPYAPEFDIHAPENQWLLERFFGKGAVIPEFGVGKEAAIRGQLDMAAEIRKASAAPRELPPITAERDLVESQIEETPSISSMPESQEPPLAVLDEAIEPEIMPESIPEELAPELLPEPETPPAIGSMPEESPWVGESIEAPKVLSKKEAKAERLAAKRSKAESKWAGVSKQESGPAKMLTREATEEAPITAKRPIEELKAPKPKEERPAWISEEGEEIGVPPEDIATSKARAEEMKRALEGKKRAGSRMSMPEMGREGELPPIESMPEKAPSKPKPPTTSERWQSQVDALDKAKASDIEYQEIISTGSKTPLRKKETWRERVMGYIDLQKQNEAKAEKGISFSERLKGEKGALTISKGPSKPPSKPPTPPPFSWGSPGKAASGGIGSKGPLDVLKGSKFGKAVGKAYEASPYESVLGRSLDVAGNAMKSFMSTGDLSGLLRQGGALVHKKEWREAAPKMIEMFKDEAVYTKRMGHIKKDPLFKFADESGLSLPGINRGKEERFSSDIAHSIPGFGKLSQASDNAYTGFLNELRFNTFTTLLNDAVKAGYKPGREKGELAKEIAKFVNDATGTTHLGKVGEPAARLLNSLIYSPKLGASRIQMIRRINPADPKFYSQGKFVRKEALKSAFALAGMNLTTNAVTAALGGKVTYDILNSDFVKNRAGDTRVDMGAGFLQPLVLAARIMSDKYTSSTSGKTYDLGTDYGQTSTEDLLKRYLISKEAPIAGLVSDIWSGKDWQGKDKNRAIAIGERFTPLILQDMYDIVKEDPRMAPLIVPGFFGASVQTYKKPEKKQKLSMPKMSLGL